MICVFKNSSVNNTGTQKKCSNPQTRLPSLYVFCVAKSISVVTLTHHIRVLRKSQKTCKLSDFWGILWISPKYLMWWVRVTTEMDSPIQKIYRLDGLVCRLEQFFLCADVIKQIFWIRQAIQTKISYRISTEEKRDLY